ncbi:MAG: MBOAT family protein [Ruminococcus sp.]|nr:MBOAT family protein [Ruminococcus sp.]
MLFADLLFLYFFLPVCLICYFLTRSTDTRNIVLIVFSFIFCAWGDPKWVAALLISAVMNYFTGRFIGEHKGISGKLTLAFAIIFDIGLFGLYKYILPVTSAASILTMPMGLGFYTLQTISYNVECFRRKVEPERSFIKFLLYISFFAKLSAGPVVRYSTIGEELTDRKTTIQDFSEGFTKLSIGLCKKAILANYLADAVHRLFGEKSDGYAALSSLSVLGCWLGAAMTMLWLYFDISGYCDIASGIGRIFGFHFGENFNYPMVCKSIRDFMDRWFISLTSFFKDHMIYTKLFAGKMKGIAYLLGCVLMGLWHGLDLNFLIWGLFLGIFMMTETFIGKKRMKKMPAAAAHIYTKLILIISFGMFYFNKLPALVGFLKGLIGLNGNAFADAYTGRVFLGNIWLFAAAILFSLPVIPKLREKAFRSAGSAYAYQAAGVICNALLLLAGSLMLSSRSYPFIYFNI